MSEYAEPQPPYVTVHGTDATLVIERDQFGALALWIRRTTDDGSAAWVKWTGNREMTIEAAKAIYGAAGLREQPKAKKK